MDQCGSCRDLEGAQGKLVVFLASLLQRADVVSVAEFGRLLAVFSDTVKETEPAEGTILAQWADLIAVAGRA